MNQYYIDAFEEIDRWTRNILKKVNKFNYWGEKDKGYRVAVESSGKSGVCYNSIYIMTQNEVLAIIDLSVGQDIGPDDRVDDVHYKYTPFVVNISNTNVSAHKFNRIICLYEHTEAINKKANNRTVVDRALYAIFSAIGRDYGPATKINSERIGQVIDRYRYDLEYVTDTAKVLSEDMLNKCTRYLSKRTGSKASTIDLGYFCGKRFKLCASKQNIENMSVSLLCDGLPAIICRTTYDTKPSISIEKGEVHLVCKFSTPIDVNSNLIRSKDTYLEFHISKPMFRDIPVGIAKYMAVFYRYLIGLVSPNLDKCALSTVTGPDGCGGVIGKSFTDKLEGVLEKCLEDIVQRAWEYVLVAPKIKD